MQGNEATVNPIDYYVPMNKIFMDKETGWTYTYINMPYEEIAKRGIVMWCIANAQGRWTMLGGSKFGFEEGVDALNFKIKFGY